MRQHQSHAAWTRHLVCGHLSAARLSGERSDEDWVARQLGGEGDALPIVTAVCRVQQDGRLAHYPALLAIERDGVEAVVEACR